MIAFWTRQNSQAAEEKSQQNALMYPLCSNSRTPYFHHLHNLNLSSFKIPCYPFACSHCHSPRSAVNPSHFHSLTPSHLLTLLVPEGRWQCCLHTEYLNTLRTGLLNCLNARSRGLTFRHRASCIAGQAFCYSPENAFYIFNQQIYFIIWYLLDGASLI